MLVLLRCMLDLLCRSPLAGRLQKPLKAVGVAARCRDLLQQWRTEGLRRGAGETTTKFLKRDEQRTKGCRLSVMLSIA